MDRYNEFRTWFEIQTVRQIQWYTVRYIFYRLYIHFIVVVVVIDDVVFVMDIFQFEILFFWLFYFQLLLLFIFCCCNRVGKKLFAKTEVCLINRKIC